MRLILTLSLIFFSLISFADKADDPEANAVVRIPVTSTPLPKDSLPSARRSTLITDESNRSVSPVEALEGAGVLVLDQSIPTVFLEGRDVLVIWDDVVINDPTSPSGSFDFKSVDMSAIERVDVLSPAEAMFYDARGIHGGIRFVTRRPQKKEYRLGIGIGSDDEYNGQASIERPDFLIQGESEQTTGQSIVEGPEADGESKWSVFARKNVDENFLDVYHVQEHQDLDLYDLDDPASYTNTTQSLVAGKKEFETFDLHAFYQRSYRETYLTGLGESRVLGERTAAFLSLAPGVVSDLALDVGSEFQRARVDESLATDGLKRDDVLFFAHARKLFDGEHVSQILVGSGKFQRGYIEKAISDSFAVKKIQTKPIVDLGWSENAPTVYQTSSIYGNSDLKTEKTAIAELHLSPDAAFDLALWDQETWDRIDFDVSTSRYFSHSQVRGIGARINSDFNGRAGHLQTTLEKVDEMDVATNQPLIGRPDAHAHFGYDFPGENWKFGSALELVGVRQTGDDVKTLPAYATVSLNVARKFSQALVELTVDNILAQKYEVYRYQKSTGTTWLLHTSLTF